MAGIFLVEGVKMPKSRGGTDQAYGLWRRLGGVQLAVERDATQKDSFAGRGDHRGCLC